MGGRGSSSGSSVAAFGGNYSREVSDKLVKLGVTQGALQGSKRDIGIAEKARPQVTARLMSTVNLPENMPTEGAALMAVKRLQGMMSSTNASHWAEWSDLPTKKLTYIAKNYINISPR